MAAPTSMDVDDTPMKGEEEGSSPSGPMTTTKIAVHPLAIVNMSDQYTRVTCGGSPLSRDAPVVGLLFGKILGDNNKLAAKNKQQSSSTSSLLQVMDADDIPTDASEAASTQVSLHQAVFPQHAVVGWYRVCSDDNATPAANDVALTQQLQSHYGRQPFVFALLQVPSCSSQQQQQQQQQQAGEDRKQHAIIADGSTKVGDGGGNDNEEDDDLPLMLYHFPSAASAVPASGGNEQVLEAMEDWVLETSDAERVAVERVLREQPAPPAQANHGTTKGSDGVAATAAAAGGTAAGSSSSNNTANSRFAHATSELEHSLSVLESRLETLKQFLLSVQRLPADDERYPHALVRQVHSVLLHIHLGGGGGCGGDFPPAAATTTTSGCATASPALLAEEDAAVTGMGVQQLAFLAKTLDSVQSYADKFKLVQENQHHQSHDHRSSSARGGTSRLGGGGGGTKTRSTRSGRY